MTTEYKFTKEGKVSVWFSTQPYQQVPEAYFQANEHGQELWMQNFHMTDVEVENLELNGVEEGLGSIIDILGPCSYASGYAGLVEHKIKKMGESQIAWVLLLFDYEYRPKKTKIYQDETLRFVGSYPYDMDDVSLMDAPEPVG
ncbi:MAG: hypothetical protein GY881_11085 [Gammaproteobacteria bacterium]|jgi:hypothetical protein|nr:hypothetical protein [Gammaproteobacteria bacterium]MCP4879854.1 hypothetical protein [Gammaproteobacteria bacterium]MDP6164903.1 immunity 22 family protein [Gammaproteobacteria bacterium]